MPQSCILHWNNAGADPSLGSDELIALRDLRWVALPNRFWEQDAVVQLGEYTYENSHWIACGWPRGRRRRC